ncbi:FadR/GntR family transcriptional regulator [Lichenicola cladoniae]|nr:FadR/GntR family transcriptional regulator [Lichenicola cladoniae]
MRLRLVGVSGAAMVELIKPGEPRRLYQQIADRVRAMIHDFEFQPGTRLPAERELAQQLGVSRPSLREALIALEIDGTVEVRMGSGIYVSVDIAGTEAPPRWLGESPAEIMQARITIEGGVAAMASARMTKETIGALRTTLEVMGAQSEAGQRSVEQDRQFHVLLVAQCGNAILTRIVGELFDERHNPLSSKLRGIAETAETWRAAVAEHEAIVLALEARDPLLAEAAMRMHLKASTERWFGI